MAHSEGQRRSGEFGVWMASQRKRRLISQDDLSAKSRISRSLIAMIESQGIIPRQEKLEILINALGMDEDSSAMTLLRAGYFPPAVSDALMQHPEGLGRLVLNLAARPASYAQAIRIVMPKAQQVQQATDRMNVLIDFEAKTDGGDSRNFEKFKRALKNMQAAQRDGNHANFMEYWRHAEHWLSQFEGES